MAAQDQTQNLSANKSDITNVRVFVGFTISGEMQDLIAPTVVTIIEYSDRIECRFVTFPGTPVALKAEIPVPEQGEKMVFEGKSQDPRGWTVQWTAELVGNEIMGTFTQPHDEGQFLLLEAYLE